MNTNLEQLLKKASSDEAILAILLFGSHARGNATAQSDIDVCFVLQPTQASPQDQIQTRLNYLSEEKIDLQIFQALPLYIRSRVLKEATVLSCQDLDQLYEVAYRTAKAFEDFKPRYHQYLAQVAHAG